MTRGSAPPFLELSYPDALRAVAARGRFGIRLGLGRTRALLHALGDPQLTFRGALVAGTNGKGSVQELVASALRAAGHRVGQTPKPHLVSYRERVVVDGMPIAREDLARVLSESLEASHHLPRGLGELTEFEILTASAFLWFARCRVDAAVVEVGLGGRLDATNVWDGGVATITNVELDHMDRLGDTREAIAREKAAIIKRGDRAVTGADGGPRTVIRRRAAALHVPLVVSRVPRVLAVTRRGLVLSDERYGEFEVGLLGRHQAANAGVALATIEALGEAGIVDIPVASMLSGLAAARWPGRLELLSLERSGGALPASPDGPSPGAPDVLLDGAHNAAGTASLAAALDELRPQLSGGRLTLVMGMVADKDVRSAVRELARAESLASARIIATAVPGARSCDPNALAELWREQSEGAREGISREITSSVETDEALASGEALARLEDGPLLVAGSLYLVGAARRRLLPDAISPDPA